MKETETEAEPGTIRMVARSSCRKCYGRGYTGTFTVPGKAGEEKLLCKCVKMVKKMEAQHEKVAQA